MVITISTTYTDPAEIGGERQFQFFISEAGGCRYWEWWDDLSGTIVTLRRCD